MARIKDNTFKGLSKLNYFNYKNEPIEKYRKVDSNEFIRKIFIKLKISLMIGESVTFQENSEYVLSFFILQSCKKSIILNRI